MSCILNAIDLSGGDLSIFGYFGNENGFFSPRNAIDENDDDDDNNGDDGETKTFIAIEHNNISFDGGAIFSKCNHTKH